MIPHTPHPAGLPAPGETDARPMSSGTQARALARSYLRYVSAVWRGDPSAARFASWIDSFWAIDLPPVPADVPDAISPHGGAGHGISWFEHQDEILGYVNGVGSGYRVPIAAVTSAAPLSTPDPAWRTHDRPSLARDAGTIPSHE